MKKIIHRIFFNFDDGPDPFESYLETWKTQLPDFEIMEWNKTNLPLDLNTYTRLMAAEKNHAFLSDYFRCWLLKKYGGVYLDADIEVLDGAIFRRVYEELEKTTDYTLFIGIEGSQNGRLTPHSMGLRPGSSHEILDFLLNLYETAFSTALYYEIKRFPIPNLMTLFFLDAEKREGYQLSEKGRFLYKTEPFITKNIKIYPQSWFSPVGIRGRSKIISAFGMETCLCHHFAASWTNNVNQQKRAKLFSEQLADKEYFIPPEFSPLIEKRYGKNASCSSLPTWKLTVSEIEKLEKLLNTLIPYGSFQYKLLKRRREKG